jgi:hypothetical protein
MRNPMTPPEEPADTDDTVEISLTDRLLTPTAPAPATEASDAGGATQVDTPAWAADDEDYQPVDRKRNRWTTGLGIALLFVFGMLCGSILTHVLSPAPAPQVVYVLNDAGSGSSATTTPAPGEASPTASH